MSGAGTKGKVEHTPGPWHTDDYAMFIFGPNNETIAQTRGEGADLPIDANARLLAAAPEMLEALEALPLGSFGDDMGKHDAAEFVDNAGYFFDAMLKAKVAIQKARGQR